MTQLESNNFSGRRFRALVLDADSAAGLETVQSLGRGGCIVHTAGLRPEYSRNRSSFIRRQIELAASQNGEIHELVDLFQAENYDLIVPPTEVALLAMLSPEIPDDMYQRAVLPPRSSVRTALDKQAVLDLAQRVGVKVPPGELVSADSRPPENFPVVLKPIFSKMSTSGAVREFHVTVARNLNQWRTALGSTYKGIRVQQQQYISGKGVGVEMLFEHGAMRWTFLHERVHEYPLTGGGSSYRVSIESRDDLVRSATSLLSALQWHGVAMVEFKVTSGGEAYLIEINPRLWGSLALAIDCGVDFPLGLLSLSTRQSLPGQPKYRIGHFTRNIYRDVEWFKANRKADHSDPLLHTRPVISSALEWLRPLAGRESWDFFCWSDLGVFIGELKTLFREHWSRVLRVIKRRGRNVYLRYLQQPRLLARLRRHQTDTVLFLCHGNICRSPLAAALAAKRFPNTSFSSAGFYPEVGRPSPDFVRGAASGLGVDLAQHRSQRVSAQLINEAGLVVIMDVRNRELLKTEFPRALEKAIFLGMLRPKAQLEIKDPFDFPDSMQVTSSEINCAIERLGSLLM